MPSKSSGASSSNLPTRASTRSKLTASGSLAVTENAPIRTTRSTRVASAAGGPAAPTAAKAASNGTRGISELIVKKLRPLAERNTGNTQSTTVPESDSGAAMLAATKKALRPVAAGVKLEDREPIKVRYTTPLYHVKRMTYSGGIRFARRIFAFDPRYQTKLPQTHLT